MSTAHAKELWQRTGGLTEVELDGSRAWVLADDEPVLAGAESVAGVRLLANLDPLHADRDRELLVPDVELRTRTMLWIG